MEVHWFEQSLAEISERDDWLGSWERSHLETLRFPKRRADWRLGRWTAKHAVACELRLPRNAENFAHIEVRPSESGAPEVLLGNVSADLTISISHRAGVAACAVGNGGAMLGCDLEIIEPRSYAFVADYFTEEEQEVVRRAGPEDQVMLIALIWSAKESALKALRVGLRIDTRSLSVVLGDSDVASLNDAEPAAHGGPRAIHDWNALRVYTPQQVFHGWWFRSANLIRTGVSNPSTPRPSRFTLSNLEHSETLCSSARERF